MKYTLQRLQRHMHVVIGNVGMGVIPTMAGLIQGSVVLTWAGIVWTLASVAVLVAVRCTEPVLTGVIVDLQQPQLPDAHLHTQCAPPLPEAA